MDKKRARRLSDLWASGGMHADLERTLSFPSYYGHNFDALRDCVEEEFVVPENGGVVVVFRRFDELQRAGLSGTS